MHTTSGLQGQGRLNCTTVQTQKIVEVRPTFDQRTLAARGLRLYPHPEGFNTEGWSFELQLKFGFANLSITLVVASSRFSSDIDILSTISLIGLKPSSVSDAEDQATASRCGPVLILALCNDRFKRLELISFFSFFLGARSASLRTETGVRK
uniref:Uncharacterized protein n=1 Tax=Rhodosorus marinus TaxID=101924 RepID=A0A7S0BQ49_9RHOD|mmetsp:Transcript_3496/g.4981  ORF Transcript_3496/g.4981 Transcript_3496/m.4981 type:complete len:152 (+) Transcript_3496:83-538(+)